MSEDVSKPGQLVGWTIPGLRELYMDRRGHVLQGPETLPDNLEGMGELTPDKKIFRIAAGAPGFLLICEAAQINRTITHRFSPAHQFSNLPIILIRIDPIEWVHG